MEDETLLEENTELFAFVTGKFTDFSVWLFGIFIRELSHLTISSPFILVNQKISKNHNRFCLLLAFAMHACRHFCYLLHGFFLGKYKC